MFSKLIFLFAFCFVTTVHAQELVPVEPVAIDAKTGRPIQPVIPPLEKRPVNVVKVYPPRDISTTKPLQIHTPLTIPELKESPKSLSKVGINKENVRPREMWNAWPESGKYGITQEDIEDKFEIAWQRLSPYRQTIIQSAKKHQLPPEILFGAIIQESGGSARIGFGQFKSDTWAKECVGSRSNPSNQIDCMGKYKRKLANYYPGTKSYEQIRLSILSYNVGHAHTLEIRNYWRTNCKQKTEATGSLLLQLETGKSSCPGFANFVRQELTPGTNNGFKHLRLVEAYARLAREKLNK